MLYNDAQRFAALRRRGFLALTFLIFPNYKYSKKLSKKAQNPRFCKTAVICSNSAFIFSVSFDSQRCDLQNSCCPSAVSFSKSAVSFVSVIFQVIVFIRRCPSAVSLSKVAFVIRRFNSPLSFSGVIFSRLAIHRPVYYLSS
jgi:hypothetical protein